MDSFVMCKQVDVYVSMMTPGLPVSDCERESMHVSLKGSNLDLGPCCYLGLQTPSV